MATGRTTSLVIRSRKGLSNPSKGPGARVSNGHPTGRISSRLVSGNGYVLVYIKGVTGYSQYWGSSLLSESGL